MNQSYLNIQELITISLKTIIKSQLIFFSIFLGISNVHFHAFFCEKGDGGEGSFNFEAPEMWKTHMFAINGSIVFVRKLGIPTDNETKFIEG